MNREDRLIKVMLRHHEILIYTIESMVKVAKKEGLKDSTFVQAERVLNNVKEDIHAANSGGNQPNSFQFRR